MKPEKHSPRYLPGAAPWKNMPKVFTFLIVLLIIGVSSLNWWFQPSFAEDEASASTSLDQNISPTPLPPATETNPEVTPESDDAQTVPESSTSSAEAVSSTTVEVVPTAEPTLSPAPLLEAETNDSTISTSSTTLVSESSTTSEASRSASVNLESNTGNNQGDTSISSGTASSSMAISDQLNTTVDGNNLHQAVVSTADSNQDWDYSDIDLACEVPSSTTGQLSASVSTQVTNVANVDYSLELVANSGSNTSTADINTEDATVQANVSALINTTLIGENAFFGVFNVFNLFSSDLILPYEQSILTNSSEQPTDFSIQSANEATIAEAISVHADSGNNSGSSVVTGEATSTVQNLTTANTSIYGNNWILIKILNPHYWQGELPEGGVISQDEQSISYLIKPVGETLTSGLASQTVDVTNQATINTNITATALTGDNQATGSVSTGNASVLVNTNYMVNTTIVGQNWMYVQLNLFDTYSGRIIFPRADLYLKSIATPIPGTSAHHLYLTVGNQGRIAADNTIITLSIPSSVDVIGSNEILTVGKLVPGESKTFVLTTQALQSGLASVEGAAQASSSIKEDNLNDNSTAFILKYPQAEKEEVQPSVIADKPKPIQQGRQSLPVVSTSLTDEAISATEVQLLQLEMGHSPVVTRYSDWETDLAKLEEPNNNGGTVLGVQKLAPSPLSTYQSVFCQRYLLICNSLDLIAGSGLVIGLLWLKIRSVMGSS